MNKEELVQSVKRIVALAKDGKLDEAYTAYTALFSDKGFGQQRSEDQRQALRLMVHAKNVPTIPTPKMVEAHGAALGPLTELVSLHSEPGDYEMLGMCRVVLGQEEAAMGVFKAALQIERARNPSSDLCGALMRRVSTLVILRAGVVSALFAIACAEPRRDAGPAPSASHAAKAPRYLALGDSFTIGTGTTPDRSFPARLAARWAKAGCDVALENLGVNGFTTGDLIARELPAARAFAPTFVTLAIGANDIVRGGSEAAYVDALGRIFDGLAASGVSLDRVIALPQPDWAHSPTAASFGDPEELAKTIARYNDVLHEIATKRGARWVDLVPLMQRQAQARRLADDGLHPSEDAYDEWASALAAALPSPCAA